jgi:hypothetical protein
MKVRAWDTERLLVHLASLRIYHAAAAPDHVYSDEVGPLASSITDIKAELARRLEVTP